MTIEECLRRLQDRAAMLRYLADCAAVRPETPDPRVLSGVADACGEIQEMARACRLSLDLDGGKREIKT